MTTLHVERQNATGKLDNAANVRHSVTSRMNGGGLVKMAIQPAKQQPFGALESLISLASPSGVVAVRVEVGSRAVGSVCIEEGRPSSWDELSVLWDALASGEKVRLQAIAGDGHVMPSKDMGGAGATRTLSPMSPPSPSGAESSLDRELAAALQAMTGGWRELTSAQLRGLGATVEALVKAQGTSESWRTLVEGATAAKHAAEAREAQLRVEHEDTLRQMDRALDMVKTLSVALAAAGKPVPWDDIIKTASDALKPFGEAAAPYLAAFLQSIMESRT